MHANKKTQAQKMIMIGVQGVQGSGKSTAVQKLCREDSKNYGYISLDDFYLPQSEIQDKFEKTQDNAYQYRGNPGTHDIELLVYVLKTLRSGNAVHIPKYNKYAHEGKGDREKKWKTVKPKRIIFVEGWCIGFAPIHSMSHVDNSLIAYAHILNYLDGLFIMVPPYLNIVYKWREEAEEKARMTNQNAMSSSEIISFVDIYMTTYNTYLDNMYANPPIKPAYFVQLDEKRQVISAWLLR
mgnify:CR=1 FL=1|tara:strand:- start:1820 stop:2536 length:717 start_codon:yes stop_codon:yes gene_type:complete